MTSMLAMPRLPAPTATVSPRLTGRLAAARRSGDGARDIGHALARRTSGGHGPSGAAAWTLLSTGQTATGGSQRVFGSKAVVQSAPMRGSVPSRSSLLAPLSSAGAPWLTGSARPRRRSSRPRSSTRSARTSSAKRRYEEARKNFRTHRRAPSELLVRAARAVPHRRGVLPRGGVRQGGQGVRDVHGVLSRATRSRTSCSTASP